MYASYVSIEERGEVLSVCFTPNHGSDRDSGQMGGVGQFDQNNRKHQHRQHRQHDGDQQPTRFHAVWLRDNARDSHTRSAVNGQRLITLADIPEAISIDQIELRGDQLEVRFAPCHTACVYPLEWLYQHRYDDGGLHDRSLVPDYANLFDHSLSLQKVTARFADVVADQQALLQWLRQLRTYGFAKLTDGPVNDGALLEVAELIGFVRETNYGRWFEVRNEPSPGNLAYTSAGLQAHTDNPYRDPVPTLQLLYCLQNSAQGGESQVIDGFNAAVKLHDQNPALFETLSSHCASFEFGGQSDVQLQASMPMIELRVDGELRCIRFNNRSTGAISGVPFDQMANYYNGYRAFGDLINDPAMQLGFKLDPGECFVVDNCRVLHARTAFELDAAGAGRWLQGCYIDGDGLTSKIAVLEQDCA